MPQKFFAALHPVVAVDGLFSTENHSLWIRRFGASVASALMLGTLVWAMQATPARTQPAPSRSQPLITQPVNNNSLVTLSGNTRGEARNPANDRGLVPDSMPMPNMRVQLHRPAAQEQALNELIVQLHDRNSPNYQQWLTAADIGAQFGPAASDIAAVSAWLQQRGFTINSVAPSGMLIDFSGTAGQVRGAFGSEIHNITVNGTFRYGNISDPQIPAALAPAVVGILGLNDIPSIPQAKRPPRRAKALLTDETQANCSYAGYVTGTTCYGLVPADIATIYNFNPVFNTGNTGQGQTIYVVEEADIYSNSATGSPSVRRSACRAIRRDR